MKGGVLFKQRYKPKNLPTTPILNVKHLTYIATRPGAIYNPGCGFGLWGRLPGVREPTLVNDFRAAKEAVYHASRQPRTIWRAILSVDSKTAEDHGLYDRKNWEKLVNQKIGVLAREMGIRDKDFCWVAAMHYAKGHPHVHIMYWDNSDTPHEEKVTEGRFELLSERVRGAFTGELHREELTALRAEQKELDSQLRLELKALLQEANVAEALNLRRFSQEQMSDLAGRFLTLIQTLPSRGALKYKLLPEEGKEGVQAFLDYLLTMPEFARLSRRYFQLTNEMSGLYGNGAATAAHNLERAKQALYTDMGNELLRVVKACRSELEEQVTAEMVELKGLLSKAVPPLLSGNSQYRALLATMPELRTPMAEIRKDPAFLERRRALVGELAGDFRIQALLRGYQAAVQREKPETDGRGSIRDAYRALGQLVDRQLRQDAGYEAQARAGAVTELLIRLFGTASRSTGQMSARQELAHQRSRNLSKAAQRDRAKHREMAGDWDQER